MTLKRAEHPFQFVTQANLIELTGARARNVQELLTFLKTAPASVIYHHTHHFLKQHQFLSPEPPNDFAYWVTHVLNESRLGEQLVAIDTIRFGDIASLQREIVDTIERFLQNELTMRLAPAGAEFHFMKSKSFLMPTPYVAKNLADFSDCVGKVSIYSLYHHIFEARLRLGREGNDLSLWLANELGEAALAKEISRLDPYTHTMEGLRRRILQLTQSRIAKQNLEVSLAT